MLKNKILLFLAPVVVFGFFFLVTLGILGVENEDLLFTGDLTAGTCEIGGDYDPKKIDSVLEDAGAFKGQRPAFEKVAQKYNIDPVLMIAISIHETGWGKSQAVLQHNNPSGQMTSGGLIHFNTLAEGLDMTGQTINNLWNERGLNTIEKLGSAYAPIGASNDPTGLNNHWVPTITKFVEMLGGLSGGCDGASEENANLQAGANGFSVPLKNYTITSPFGYRDFRGMEFHRGLDMAASEGEPIYASKAGTITIATMHPSWGYYIAIEHEGGMVTLYAHQSKLVGVQGQKVQQGQLIGYVGSTGDSTGAHLHLEMCKDSSLAQAQLIDPYPIIFNKGVERGGPTF